MGEWMSKWMNRTYKPAALQKSFQVFGIMTSFPRIPTFLSMEPVNVTLYGKKEKHFADMIKDLERERRFCISQVSPKCNPMHPYNREAEGGLTAQTKAMWPQRQRLEWCGHSYGMLAATRSWKSQGTDSAPKPPEGAPPCWHLVFCPVTPSLGFQTVRE